MGDMNMETYNRISRYFPLVGEVYLDAWGEPLLNPQIWEMAALARRAGCSVGITTNGTLLSKESIAQTINLTDVVGISVDGADPDTYERIRTGARFNQVIDNVKALVAARREAHHEKPFISLLFMKMKENIAELPSFIDLAGEIAVDEVIASNLSYVATSHDDERRAFSYTKPCTEFVESVEEAKIRARKYGLTFRVYPLQPESIPYCEARPLEELYISWDGEVSPCVYLNLPLKGHSICRVYRGKNYAVPCTSFGNLREENLLAIWGKADYQRFRGYFAARMQACYQRSGYAHFGVTDDGNFRNVDEKAKRTLRRYPLPDVCRSCYKARGI
jgi:MoaA/NifB/PqqE/SkfB family radical SAM enzyme